MENKQELSSINCFAFDLDGVVYLGSQPIPHAADTINELMKRNKAVYFLTNNSGSTRDDYVKKLAGMNVHIRKESIYTSAYATALHLQSVGAVGSNAFVIGESGVQQELSDIGINVFSDPSTVERDKVDYVIVGIDRQFSYLKLSFAHECIVRGHAKFIATNRDSTYPSEIGSVPGSGSLVISLATSTSVEPLTIGKPEPTALLEIVKAANATLKTTLMVGDRLDTDIAGGNRAGTKSACVLTGVTSRESAESAEGDERATIIIDDLRGLL